MGCYFVIATLALACMAQKTFFSTYLGVAGSFGGSQSSPSPGPRSSADEALYYVNAASMIVIVVGAVCPPEPGSAPP